MATGGKAGRSAIEKAERLEKMAAAYRKGAAGEESTARILAALSPRGFHIFHDLQVPGSKANIDHLVVGPTGVFVIDSKQFTTRMSFNKGTVWAGRRPYTKKLQTTAWEAERARIALGVPVHAIQCIHGTAVPIDTPQHGTRMVAPDALTALVAGGPVTLGLEDVARLALRVPSAFGSAGVEHLPPAAVGASVGAAVHASASAAVRSAALVRVPAADILGRPVATRRRRAPSFARALPTRILGLILLLALWLAATKALPGIADSASKRLAATLPTMATTTTSTTVAPPPLRVPGPVKGSYVCPKPNWGWVFQLAWPGDQPGLVGYQVEWLTPSGHWATSLDWKDKTRPWELGAAKPGSSLTVRVRALGPGALAEEWASGKFTAPKGRC